MSNQLKDKCPICNGYMFDDDDIVYCPICGAPHHRECWNAVGHCGLAQLHGTKDQYDGHKDDVHENHNASDICPNCKKEIPHGTAFCPYCGNITDKDNLNEQKETGNGIPFMPLMPGVYTLRPDPYGGVDKNSEIDGVKVSILAKFISFGPNKLLPKFKSFIQNKTKTSWSWIGFLSPYSHTLFRKMNLATLLYILVEIIGFILLSPMYYSISTVSMPDGATTMQLYNTITADPLKYFTVSSLICGIIGVVLIIGMRIFAGLFNDYLYMKHCVKTIKNIQQNNELDTEEELAKKGGNRPFLALMLFTFSLYFGGLIEAIIAGVLFG